ncbi:hypothetical protein ACPYIV_10330 [Parabacteroides sp. ASD2025]|jgi:hypothetical protein|uniref:hypothetical protein n=1 Tax=Parabacteroides sp. ASD2025 TaxID=3415987 RepID=UPI0025EEB8A7|nr:hypothetical protein [uncultured Parabacteroides sp.]
MKKDNINLTILLCLLLSFCSGFASCGDDEKEYTPWIEVALEKADVVYLESNTLYGITNKEGELQIRVIDGKIQYRIYYRHQDGSELYFNPVNLPESLFSDYSFGDSFGTFVTIGVIRFSGEVKPRLEGMECTPIVLDYAEIILNWFLDGLG